MSEQHDITQRGLIERLTEIANRDSAVAVTVRADDLRALLSQVRAPVADAQTFEQWWHLESHRRKYPSDHPVYLAAREAWEAKRPASTPVADEQFKAAFPNGVLTAARFHELWESAGHNPNPDRTLLENLAWQVGKFAGLVAKEASSPVADERQAVAYLDLGTGGYVDVGTDLTDEQLAALPKGRHMLAIIGTHGVNGYTPASAPVADERPAFEAYARRNGYPLNGHGGFYGNNRTRNQWMGWKARAAMASAPVATRQYHYRMSNCTPGRPECRDGNGYPECPCWHDVGTGPLAGKEATATDWRDKPSAPVQWPTMPPSKGQSPVLFEDGYAEGWAKCMDECRRALVAASNYIDKLGGDSKTYRAALASAPVDKPAPEHFKPPFDNCSFRMCDLPGQCRGEGKCHHPASAPVAGEAQAQGKLVAVLNVVENGFGRTVDVEMLEAGNQLPTGRWAVSLAVPAE